MEVPTAELGTQIGSAEILVPTAVRVELDREVSALGFFVRSSEFACERAPMTTIVVGGDGDVLAHQSVELCPSSWQDQAFIGVLSQMPFESVILQCDHSWHMGDVALLV